MSVFKKYFITHFPFVVFYSLFIVTGIYITDDYGISWDETACRSDMGIVNWDYVSQGDYEALQKSDAKYHGPAFEIFLYKLELLSGLDEMYDIFFMRHLLTFLLFALSVIFFYALSFKYFKNRWFALLGTAFLILSPRIFADAFYNSKDLPFLSLTIIAMYTAGRFIERPSIGFAFLHAIICAILIDIRIMGIMIPLFTVVILLLKSYKSKELLKKILWIVPLYFCMLIPLVILFWPIMWIDPVNNMIAAWEENSKFPWPGNVFFRGKLIPAAMLPWYYVPLWILISTPILYICLFIAGIYFLTRRLIRKMEITWLEWMSILIFFFSLASVILLKSVLYDGWRHLFFIYPSFLFICFAGIAGIFKFFDTNHKASQIFTMGIVTYCLYMIIVMTSLHPFENLYFNSLAGKDLSAAREKYEIDYWGLSYKQGLQYLLENVESEKIEISASEFAPAYDNALCLPSKARSRISMRLHPELSDFYLTTYRMSRQSNFDSAFYHIVSNNGIVLSIFDLRENDHKVFKEEYRVSTFSNSFENPDKSWSEISGQAERKISHGNLELLSETAEYGTGLHYKMDHERFLVDGSRNYLFIQFRAKSNEKFHLKAVCQLDSAAGKMYAWTAEDIYSSADTAWNDLSSGILIPEILTSNSTMKVYLWNPGKHRLSIDDICIGIYSVPPGKINELPGIWK